MFYLDCVYACNHDSDLATVSAAVFGRKWRYKSHGYYLGNVNVGRLVSRCFGFKEYWTAMLGLLVFSSIAFGVVCSVSRSVREIHIGSVGVRLKITTFPIMPK